MTIEKSSSSRKVTQHANVCKCAWKTATAVAEASKLLGYVRRRMYREAAENRHPQISKY